MAPVLVAQPEPVITKETRLVRRPVTTELVALCPKCKTLETLWFNRDGLIQTGDFTRKMVRCTMTAAQVTVSTVPDMAKHLITG